MTSVEDRVHLLRDSVSHRRGQSGSGMGWKQDLFLSLGVLVACGLCFVSGAANSDLVYEFTGIGGVPEYSVVDSGDGSGSGSVDSAYLVGEYTVLFQNESHPDMQGLNGYAFKGDTDRFFLNSDLARRGDVSKLYSTCVHEKLHTLGVSEDRHDWVEVTEGEIVDETCLGLLFEMDGRSWKSQQD